eukprot:CAMPEP_0204180614 /NCGR_PEP_ID=MMETSP0361-20130328/51168_1 /ASSEMBLY_ACC=CAM_ASM_000343 /TAXON_ID=268821 /ORGANISM="Scrippsiella Hangoei, Strain SHTV-5" /LENGTH=30 /DNA_ID= /DNA_START= /DNA_END= /DNA_ORIENTATION=
MVVSLDGSGAAMHGGESMGRTGAEVAGGRG